MSVPQEVRDYMSKLGKRSLETMTADQRKERARKAGLSKGKNKKWKNLKS